jgi:ribonuclease HII
MVVAGVLVEEDAGLKELGVRDSKQLATSKRESMAKELRSSVRYEIRTASAEDIDLLRSQMTMNVLESKLFATVIECLGAKLAYVDAADTNEGEFARLIARELGPEVRIVSKHGADALYPVVSAASIIAKTERDRLVREIQKQFGQDIGSGYPSDQVTISFLKDWYREHGDLPPHTRRSWKTARRIMSEVEGKSLDDF